MAVKPKVIIVGSGIIGASVALACQDLGADVTVLEQGSLGGIASGNSFGWINASFAENQAYFDLRKAALESFRALDQRLVLGDYIRWQGTLWWEDAGPDFVEQFRSLTLRGYPASIVDEDQIALLEPYLRQAPSKAILTATEGAAHAQKVALAVLAAVERNGGSVRGGVSLKRIEQVTGRVCSVQTDAGNMACDVVVLATGAAAKHRLPGVDWKLPMANKKGMILKTNALPQVINHTLMTPDVHFRQNPDGSFTAGEIFSGEIDPNVDPMDLAVEVLDRIQKKLRDVPTLSLSAVNVGVRPVPLDGLPVIGEVPGVVGVFSAVMHSGVTLGPLVGHLLASEILQGVNCALLEPFRPSRFSEPVL